MRSNFIHLKISSSTTLLHINIYLLFQFLIKKHEYIFSMLIFLFLLIFYI